MSSSIIAQAHQLKLFPRRERSRLTVAARGEMGQRYLDALERL
jgi:hypothetical protein